MSDFDVDIRWAQINNAIVPVVHRKCDDILTEVPLVPLLVIRHAVGLLKDVHVDTVSCTDDEARALTKCCQDVGIKICFDVTTELINLDCLPDLSEEKVVFSILATRRPFICDGSLSDSEEATTQELSLKPGYTRDCLSSETLSEDNKKIGEKKMKRTDRQLNVIIKIEDGQISSQTADISIMTNEQVDGVSIRSKSPPWTNTCSKKILVTTRFIFGEQVHCLLKDGEYYALIEELHRLFFCHIDLVLFIRIFRQLADSTVHLPLQEMSLPAPLFGDIKCNMAVNNGEVKGLLVQMKAILERLKRRTMLSGIRTNTSQTWRERNVLDLILTSDDQMVQD
ncbi:hypothetical protein LSH36_89g08009 [Paralvinella palmiformis]|uniref:Uncharacterized protein n=1 Tax=Paralvinella palmiformis TaxID=53620 RepID=A0AAD9K159_9ANNE|nr:hypothetical protein LSH36_89g08009 [Paralvinella palmiformis]